MSNNTTGCTNVHMVPIKRHLNPVNIVMQPFGECTPTCPAGAQDDNASIRGCVNMKMRRSGNVARRPTGMQQQAHIVTWQE